MFGDCVVYWIDSRLWDAFQDVVRVVSYELEIDEVLDVLPQQYENKEFVLLRPPLTDRNDFRHTACTLHKWERRLGNSASGLLDGEDAFSNLLVRRRHSERKHVEANHGKLRNCFLDSDSCNHW